MDDDKQDDTSPAQASSRKRAPPTIDLTAASVSDSDAASNNNAPAGAGKPEAKPRVSMRDRARGWLPSMKFSNPFSRSKIATPSAGIGSARPARNYLSMFIAAVVGAILTLLVAGGIWFFGDSGISSRIVARLPQTTAKTDRAASNKRTDKPAAQASNAVTQSSAADSSLNARVDAIEKSIASLRDDLAAARGSIDEIKSTPAQDLGPIIERIAKIERATVALTGEIASPQKFSGEDPHLRIVATATLLDTSVRQGEPYSTALASAKSLTSDAPSLKPLDEFATTGIPSASALSKDLLALLPQLARKPATPAAAAGMMDRLAQGASKLVRIQRTDGVVDATTSTIANATQAARRDDIATARRELDTLPALDRAPVQAWMDKIDARGAALNASKQFALDSTTALSKPAQ